MTKFMKIKQFKKDSKLIFIVIVATVTTIAKCNLSVTFFQRTRAMRFRCSWFVLKSILFFVEHSEKSMFWNQNFHRIDLNERILEYYWKRYYFQNIIFTSGGQFKCKFLKFYTWYMPFFISFTYL